MQPTCSIVIPNYNEEECQRIFQQELMGALEHIPYPLTPAKRLVVTTKYSYRSMVRLARNAIFSFSNLPMHLTPTAGFLVLQLAIIQLTYVFIKLSTGVIASLVPGWTTPMLGTLLIGGFQLVMISLQGYYLVMIFQEIKKRPAYILREKLVPPKIIIDKESN